MHSFKDALNLIDYSKAGFNHLKLEYGYCTDTQTITPGLPVMIQNFLQNAKSALDFSTHALYTSISDQPTEPAAIRFPYAWFGATEMEFAKKFDIDLPQLRTKRPDIYQILNSYQYYQSENNTWLPELMEMINHNRYADLGFEPIEEVNQVVTDFGMNRAGLIIRGEGTIELGENARIESRHSSITGEQIISVKHPEIKNKEGRITSKVNKHVLIYFESNGQEVIDFLSEVLYGVSRIIADLERSAHQTESSSLP